MKAVSLWQPWASFLVSGHKRYETRGWATNYRGNIAIHAAKKWDKSLKSHLNQLVLKHPELADYAICELPFGCVIAAMRLVAIHKTEDIRGKLSPLELAVGDYSNNRFAWELELIKVPESPIPAKGMQGLFEWSP
jgi:hypothetical protein